MSKPETRTRRPNARAKEIVFGAIDERLIMIDECRDLEIVKVYVSRLRELIDELKRSVSKKTEGEEAS